MTPAPLHPQLRLRPVRNPHLRRPSLEYPVLGKLEYVNTDGGWWQGTTEIDGTCVRTDVNKMSSNLASEEFDPAGRFLTWIRGNGARLRQYIAEELSAGNVFELQKISRGPILPSDLPNLSLLRPFMLIIEADSARLKYECDSLPMGQLLGFSTVQMTIEVSSAGFAPKQVRLFQQALSERGERLLARAVPDGEPDFINSLSDQFLAAAGSRGYFKFDAALRTLLDEAIGKIDSGISISTGELKSFLLSISLLLAEIKREDAPEGETNG
ncbi:MAG: hypothetical protein IAF94_19600 [Pirellulaceae bacterium]|nr:hypothetical protein [Pirellulaceae bacterium]